MKLQSWKLFMAVMLMSFQFSNCLKAKRSPFDFNSPNGFVGIGFLYLTSNSNTYNQSPSNLSVISTNPTADATGISITTSFSIAFSAAVKADTIASTSVELTDTTTNTKLPLTYATSDANVTLAHNPLVAGRKYQLTIKGGDSGVISTSGSKLSSDYSISFTSASTVNYSGPNGMNFSSSQNAKNGFLISRNSKLYAFWSEIDSSNFTPFRSKHHIMRERQSFLL